MLSKRFATLVLACGVLGVVSSGFSQEPPPTSGRGMFPKSTQEKSLAEQFDSFTRKLLGLRPKDNQNARRPARQAMKTPDSHTGRRGSTSPRAESTLTLSPEFTGTVDPRNRESSRPGSRAARSVRQPWTGGATQKRGDGMTGSPASRAVRSHAPPSAVRTTTEDLSGLDSPMLQPLHERLRSFQRSAFDGRGPSKPSPDSAPASGSPAVPQPADSAPKSPPVATYNNLTPTVPPERTFPMGPIGRPVVVQPTSPTVAPEDGPPPVGQERGLLFARKGPVLSVETVGPRQIAVGKESAYEVTIQNRGEVGADEVVVYINLPVWTDVVGARVSAGATQAAAPDRAAQPFQWRVGPLPAQGRERLLLKIVPRESRPFDLAVRWDYQPVASQAMIEVQEPKLVVGLDGPREVFYGEKEIYTLNLSNTGNGAAENVLIKLVPIGSGGNQPVSHSLGTVEAGQRKTIQVELTARQVGNLTIKVEVRGDGGLYAELAENVLVRRAALQVDVEGPKVQYVGGVAAYRVCVRNPGTAPAKNLNFSVSLPPAAKYLSGIEGSRLEANGTKLEWDLENLEPAGEQTFLLNCRLDLPGSTPLDVVSTADGDLTASAGMTTRVEAMADLVLEVKDPTGPVPVGKEATYEIRIRNRGTKKASNVQVVIYFSRGIEPTTAEGAPHKLEPGQVVFSPIPALAPREDLLLKVYARADMAGNHIFRAEVHCRPLGTRLVSEDTTHFYQDDSVSRQASRLAPTGKLPSPAAPPPQSAVRRKPTAAPATAGRPTPAQPRR